MSRQFRSDDTDPWVHKYGNGSDGNLVISADTTQSSANAGCSGASAQKTLTLDSASTFANGDLVLIHQTRGTGVGAWELNRIASGGGSTSLTMDRDLQNTYTDSGASQAQILKLPQYNDVTVDAGKVWSAPAWDGNKGGIFAFLAKGNVNINGKINASSGNVDAGNVSKGFRGGTSGGDVSSYTGLQGEGTLGAGTNTTSSNGSGAGGGNFSGDNGRSAGGGGHADAGGNGQSTGGTTSGSADLVTMTFGGAGGQGGIGAGAHGDPVDGAGSGAIVVIIGAYVTINASTGSIECNGGSGPQGLNTAFFGASGPGAGGSILIKCKTITYGTNLITALGGSIGLNGSGSSSGTASVGRIHVDYLISQSGTSNPAADTRQDLSLSSMGASVSTFML